MDLEKNKAEYISLLSEVQREGMLDLLAWLNMSDFYEAPASSVYHANYRGGLCYHSLNVFHNLEKLCAEYFPEIDRDSIIVSALLHDLAKVGFYEHYVQNKKVYSDKGNQTDSCGRYSWVATEAYKVKSSQERDYVYSEHGVTSMLLASKFIKLTEAETVAIINHHMDLDKSGYVRTDISEIYNRYPLAALLHIADTMATYIQENPYIVNE